MSNRQVLAAVRRNQANLKRVGILAQQEVRSVARISTTLTELETIGLVRDTIPVIADRYGTVNATAASIHYNEMRDIAYRNKPVKSFNPIVPALVLSGKVDSMLDYAIASNFTTGKNKMFEVVFNGITNIVADYARETILENAEADTATTVTVQRVAEPNACAFCAMLAVQTLTFTAIGTPEDFTTFENEWHNNCNCSLETVFDDQPPIRPSYYDKMEETYKEASDRLVAEGEAAAEAQGYNDRGNREFLKNNKEYSFTTKNISRYMREVGGLK